MIPLQAFILFLKMRKTCFFEKKITKVAALKQHLNDAIKIFINKSGTARDLAEEYAYIVEKFVESLGDEASEMAVNFHLEIALNRILNRRLSIVEAEADVEKDKAEIAP
jgi:hypothetical protein